MLSRLRRLAALARRVWESPVTGVALVVVILAGVACWLLACSVPKEQGSTIQQEQRETVTGRGTTDVVEKVLSQPTPSEVYLPDGTIIRIPETRTIDRTAKVEAAESSDSAASGSASWYSSIPLGVKLILLAIGLGMLGTIGWLAMRHSRALNGAWKWTDEYMAGKLHAWRTKAAAPDTPPQVRSFLLEETANVERDRVNFHKED